MDKLFDIIIPVSYKDCGILKKTIRWVRKNIKTEGRIYILTNAECFREFPESFCQKYQVQLIDENRLLEGLSFGSVRKQLVRYNMPVMTGWYFQQFLKIGFAFSKYASDNYLIWDADTIPLQPITFFEGETILVNPKKEHHQPYFDTIGKLLGITDFAPYSFISEHMMVKTSVMKEMIEKIATDGRWVERIFECCDLSNIQAFSEFETYGNYCRNFHPSLMKPRQLLTLRCGGKLFGRQVTQEELDLLALDFDTASFERRQYPPFPRSIVAKWDRVLIEMKHRIRSRK